MSLNINLDGKRISKTVADLISPFSEIASTAADLIRIYRERTVVKILKRARAKLTEEGLKVKSVPLKFFVPLMEDCSLEDPEDETLCEMWSGLLVDAMSSYTPEHNMFVRILREITSREAKALGLIVSSGTHKMSMSAVYLPEVESIWTIEGVYSVAKRLYSREAGSEVVDFIRMECGLRAELEQFGAIVTYFGVHNGDYSSIHESERTGFESQVDPASIAMLEGNGLVRRFISSGFEFDGHFVDVHAIYITNLGARLHMACERSNGWIGKKPG